MLYQVFLSFASLVSFVNNANVGLYSYGTNQYVGQKLGNVLYYEGTANDLNGNSSGSKRIEFKLNGASNNTYAFYFYQTYSDNLHYVYDYQPALNDKFNLKMSIYFDIYYGSTKYYTFTRYYDYVHNVYESENIDTNLTFVTDNPVIASNYNIHLSIALQPVTQEEFEGYNFDEWQNGYDNGYNDGVNASNYSFMNLFASIADTPLLMLRSLFSFDLFGMSVLTVVLSLLTALMIIGIVRKFGK